MLSIWTSPNERASNICLFDFSVLRERIQSTVRQIIRTADALGDLRGRCHIQFFDSLQERFRRVFFAEST